MTRTAHPPKPRPRLSPDEPRHRRVGRREFGRRGVRGNALLTGKVTLTGFTHEDVNVRWLFVLNSLWPFAPMMM